MNNNIFFSSSSHPKIMGVAQGMQGNAKESRWFENSLPIFDLLEAEKPDLVFFKDNDYPLQHIEYAKKDFPNTKFGLFTELEEDHEFFDITINILNENHRNYLPYLANTYYSGGKKNEIYETDILMISNNVNLENETLLKWIFSIATKYRMKIYGENKVQCPYYLGNVGIESFKDLIASTKIMIMLNEEWLQTALLNDKVPLLFSNNPSNHCEFSTYSQLDELCNLHINHDMESTKITPKTYLDFCNKILEELYK
tara:strand:+ start:40201 stop:40965 length:765 start_codon:yes stop_codon:yes gene_type:complete